MKAGLTQEQAAERSGLSKQAISGQERGEYAPTEANLGLLAELYGTTKAALRYSDQVAGPEPVARLSGPLATTGEGRTLLPPRVYERVYGYLEQMRKAGLSEDEIDMGRRLMIDPLYSVSNKRDVRDRSDDELITDVDAGWAYLRILMRGRGI